MLFLKMHLHNASELSLNFVPLLPFVKTSKPIYHQNQVVRFRVVPVRPNLMPWYGSLVSVEIADASNNVFKRWLNPMTNIGGKPFIFVNFPNLTKVKYPSDIESCTTIIRSS